MELPFAKNPSFFQGLLAVSSGTWASLSGISNYTDLARLEADIAIFYLYHQDAAYESWVDVWSAYQNALVALRAESDPIDADELPELQENKHYFGLN